MVLTEAITDLPKLLVSLELAVLVSLDFTTLELMPTHIMHKA